MNDRSLIEAEFGDLSRWSQCPPFWPAKPEMAADLLQGLKQATIRTIGHSAGNRPIIAIEYGEFEPLDTTTDNLHSVLASKIVPPDPTAIYPAAFYGSRRRRKPSLTLQCAIHGGELTGTVAALNLCRIIETGSDLRGKPWPRLAELARATRLTIIPWLNPDATDRWPLPNTSGVPLELYNRCTQGIARDGTKYAYPSVKAVCPIPPEKTAFMGCYYNDAGMNLHYDMFSIERQPETLAWMRYYLAERPDGVLVLHTNDGSLMGPPAGFLPVGHQHQDSRIGGAVRARLLHEGFNVGRMSWVTLPGFGKPTFSQTAGVYHVCGAMPIMCELPIGATTCPFTCDEMLDIGLITFEEVLFYAHRDGLRPYELWDKVKKKLDQP